MKTIEIKNERFVVLYECSNKKYDGIGTKPYHKLYRSDVLIKANDRLFFTKWLEDAKFEDIEEKTNETDIISNNDGSTISDVSDNETIKLKENNESE